MKPSFTLFFSTLCVSLCAFCADEAGSAGATPAALAAALIEGVAPSVALDSGNGFYRVEHAGGDRWRMLAPNGETFVPLGVDHARLWGEGYFESNMLARFVTKEAWANDVLAKIRDWGFTTLGAACANELYHKGTPFLVYPWVGEPFSFDGGDKAILQGKKRPGTAFPNVFNPDWPQYCRDWSMKIFRPNRFDKDIVGWFFDNELAWWGEKIAGQGKYGLVDAVAKLPPEHTARQAYDAFVAEHADWPVSKVRGEFLRLIAEKYFGGIVTAMREADPNHLIMGCRFSGVWMEPELLETAGKWLDVVSFNHYPWVNVTNGEVRISYREGETSQLAAQRYREMYALARKPFFVTEWSFPANDVPGIPNKWGEGMKMPTQAERVRASELFARELMAQPFVLGYDYFMWHDSAGGGENCNYGLVNNQGEPYAALTEMFTRVHADIKAARAVADEDEPPAFQKLERVKFLEGGGSVWCFSNRARGQMLSTVFVSPEGRILVVDGGAYADGEFLRRFLKALGERVDYWFVTHAHADHFGALVEMNRGRDKPAIAIGELLFSFPERGWMERSEKTAAEEIAPWYDEFMAGIGAKIPRGDCSPGRRIALGSWSFEILNPPHLCEIRGPLNNSTVCLSVDAGGKRWLVTGDIAEDGQQALLSSLAGRERHDVVFMSHHGQHGANKDFYAKVAPEIAVWPTTRWLWDNHPKAGTVGGGPWRTNYVKCWLQELGVKRQYLLDHDVVFE